MTPTRMPQVVRRSASTGPTAGFRSIGGDFVVHLSASGAYRYGNGRKVVGLPSSIRATVSAARAAATAAGKVGYAVATKSTSLVIFTHPGSSELAWQVKTASKGGLAR